MKFFLLNAAAISITTLIGFTHGQQPSDQPSIMPSIQPSSYPSTTPSVTPSESPTKSPLTSLVTSAPATSAPVTKAPVTSAPVTKAPATSAPVTKAPVTSAPVTTAPVSRPTSAPTSAPVAKATSAPVAKATSAPAVLTSTLPGIYCFSERLDLASDTDYLACPYEIHLVSTVVGHALNALSIQRGWLETGVSSVYPDTIRNETTTEISPTGFAENVTKEVIKPLYGACQPYDCDFNSDCGPGLLCAQETRQQLKERGLHTRKANCRRNIGPTTSDVCYNATLLQRPILNVRRGLNLFDDVDQENEYDEENEFDDVREYDGRHRQLSCDGKCDPRCRNRRGACMFLYCGDCDRRRRTQEIESNRKLQTLSIDATQLASLATSKMREIATWSNVTWGDNRCKTFLQEAVCYPELPVV